MMRQTLESGATWLFGIIAVLCLQVVEADKPSRLVELGPQGAWYLEYEIKDWREKAVLAHLRANPKTWLETFVVSSLALYVIYRLSLVVREAQEFTFSRGDDDDTPQVDEDDDVAKGDSSYESEDNDHLKSQ
eukprot:m.132727 g.132727  ORF g.132727 m.132727 type:complete len:132 (+) comp29628_c5_seq2:1563-1958(+)